MGSGRVRTRSSAARRCSADGRGDLLAPGDEAVRIEERATGEGHPASVRSEDGPLRRPEKVDEGVKGIARRGRGVAAVSEAELGCEELSRQDVVSHPGSGLGCER